MPFMDMSKDMAGCGPTAGPPGPGGLCSDRGWAVCEAPFFPPKTELFPRTIENNSLSSLLLKYPPGEWPSLLTSPERPVPVLLVIIILPSEPPHARDGGGPMDEGAPMETVPASGLKKLGCDW